MKAISKILFVLISVILFYNNVAEAKSDSSLTVGQEDSQAFCPNCSLRKPPRYGKRREYFERILDKFRYFKNKKDNYEVKQHLTRKSMNENIEDLVRCDCDGLDCKCYNVFNKLIDNIM